ncbi:hypothetical protein SEA_ZIMMER_63 [Mycobacterium phage Zimmer]|nr:hypothetical protein SEA_ZIMMER_63 [Mycobacterium phage Zimmer]
MATPNAMPKRTNPIHQQILSALLATKPVKRTHKRFIRDADGKEHEVFETSTVNVLRSPLAANVSDENIERAARRWIA